MIDLLVVVMMAVAAILSRSRVEAVSSSQWLAQSASQSVFLSLSFSLFLSRALWQLTQHCMWRARQLLPSHPPTHQFARSFARPLQPVYSTPSFALFSLPFSLFCFCCSLLLAQLLWELERSLR
ncbi:hypothetical protein GQ42DRAFT_77152 [Ramicandelaber brevisporus]|nr:hypothetical protein GQ42DRAFT_77152 [Ramicandelaber brevisporus]